jgi:alkylation response protein AidB-like acyl-CoA dehydrogenase
VRDGDNFVINGQKVWTSGANYADFCFLFCRTDPDVPKHQGISIILMPMDTPGVTVRPLTEIVAPDQPDLNEVFLDDVNLPAENLVGDLNNGWRMANGSLGHERSMVWLMGVMGMESAMTELLVSAPARLADLPTQERALAADEIAGLYIDTVAARCLGYRGFARFVRTGSAPEQSLMKLYSTEARQHLARFAAELIGPDSLHSGTVRHGVTGSLEAYFTTFGTTISAGSSEIQRNIIAERVLGLPRG